MLIFSENANINNKKELFSDSCAYKGEGTIKYPGQCADINYNNYMLSKDAVRLTSANARTGKGFPTYGALAEVFYYNMQVKRMKAILLAAGKGTRISRMVKEIPKSTLPVNGIPLIRRNVDMLQKKGMEIIVCVGYQQETIRNILRDYDVTYYFNPFYDVTNSIASLWFARQELKGESLIINADVFFSDEILCMITAETRPAVMMVDRTRRKTGDYFFATTDNGCIRKYGKDLPLQYRSCEYVGMSKVTKDIMPHIAERLDKLIESGHHDMWWEDTLYSFTNEDERQIYTKDVEGHFWSEIDYFDDYERILNYLETQKEGMV